MVDHSIGLFQFFQKEIPQRIESDPESLFNLAFAMKINTKKMKKMEKEYADLKKKEQEEMVELRVSVLWKTPWTIQARHAGQSFFSAAFEERKSIIAKTKRIAGSRECRTC